MEMIIFIGAQAAGKSSFFKNRFFDSHVRVNLDMLRTRNRERILIEACLQSGQPFVIDNTNATAGHRLRYFDFARGACQSAPVSIIGFYFQSIALDCIRRNELRTGRQRVPETCIRGTINRLELPSYEEGFQQLSFVQLSNSKFVVEEWKNEV